VDSISFTQSQQQAIHRILNDVGLEVAADWPIYLDATERVVQQALHKARCEAKEPPFHATKAHKRLAKLYAGVDTTIQHYPRFSISACSRRIHGRKTRRQIKSFGRIPQPLHPGTLLHGHGKIQNGFSPLCRHVGDLGEQLVAECLQPVLHGRGGVCDGLPLE